MTRFRPCIDLHLGKVKQIVGGSLTDGPAPPRTNFVADQPAETFAAQYRNDDLTGGHIIKLGPGNDDAAKAALSAWPGGMQIGGGITGVNAREWLDCGAEKLIVTSWLFDENGRFSRARLEKLSGLVSPERLVVDLSCRGSAGGWQVAINRWQQVTDLKVDGETLLSLAPYCSEFLIHAADREGLRGGMDKDLIRLLGAECPLPVTYAGGAQSFGDLETVNRLSGGRVDLTIGSALDLFGGDVPYADCAAWNRGEFPQSDADQSS